MDAWAPTGWSHPEEPRLDRWGPMVLPDLVDWEGLRWWWLVTSAVRTYLTGTSRPPADRWSDRARARGSEGSRERAESRRQRSSRRALVELEGEPRADRSRHSGGEGYAGVNGRCSRSHATAITSSRIGSLTPGGSLLTGFPSSCCTLGFPKSEGVRDAGKPFEDDDEWQTAFKAHASSLFPPEFLGKWDRMRSRSIHPRRQISAGGAWIRPWSKRHELIRLPRALQIL